MSDYEFDETEDVDVMELKTGPTRVGLAGIARASGTVYLPGDLHPAGAFGGLMRAAAAHVPYISTGAVNAMFPADWLRGECMHDVDRLRVISNMESFIRGQ